MRKAKKFLILIIIFFIGLLFSSQNAEASAKTGAKVITESSSLNVRKTSDSSSKVIRRLQMGSYITLINKEGNKWKVEFLDGKYGYCHEKYLKVISSSQLMYVNISSGHLNVRRNADEKAEIKSKLYRGDDVIVLSQQNGFSKVIYNGSKLGYVKSVYLSSSKPSSINTSLSYSVPYYRQTDSRWKNIRIGIQGDTIGTSGCTTCCLAMTESYRTKTAVTPDIMKSRLSYASAGWLYWPSHYNTKLVSSGNYLSEIYGILKSGKPVILGSKNSYGSQHWVVVTAYSKSSDTLKASDFKINDPGSSSRTVLSQFISAYGELYKIAYYK